MKAIVIFGILLCPVLFHGQLVVKEYQKELKCNVDSVKQVPKVRATSNCGIVNIQWADQLFSGGCAGTLVRTYTFTDPCDSVIKAEQYIHLVDKTAPVLKGIPANMEVQSTDIPPVPEVTVWDNSNQLCEVIFTETKEGNIIKRTWSSSDSCDNTTSQTQIITIKPKS